MHIPSSSSEGTSNTMCTSVVGACTPNHRRASGESAFLQKHHVHVIKAKLE